jgi:2-dehydropantoate 2-reductase
VERRGPVEVDHVIGDLLRRGEAGASPLLRLAYLHLKTYQARLKREA